MKARNNISQDIVYAVGSEPDSGIDTIAVVWVDTASMPGPSGWSDETVVGRQTRQTCSAAENAGCERTDCLDNNREQRLFLSVICPPVFRL